MKKGQPITARRVDEMEVRLPLTWKRVTPILIDPHPPPSLHEASLRAISPVSLLPPNIPSYLLAASSLHLALSSPSAAPHVSRTLSIPPRSPFKSSPSRVPPRHPVPRFHPPTSSDLARRLVRRILSRRNSLSRKKREKGAKNRCATPIGRPRPGTRPALVRVALGGVA